MRKIAVTVDGTAFEVEVRPTPGEPNQFVAVVDGEELPVYVPAPGDPKHLDWMVVNRRPYELTLGPELEWLLSSGGMHQLAVHWLDAGTARPAVADGRVKAPIPGLIARVLVAPGQAVETGQPLLVLEAMKMENEVRAPRPGTVQAVKVKAGQTVMLGELMVEVA